MRRSYRIIPTYTADVSGVCSALFELGGMTVMHDPSGCNSTYNTHDETRWYDHDSLIFISGLTEIDAIMGNDDKFVHDVVSAAQELRPKFITLANSPVPYMNGTDFPALARLIEGETGIPAFYVPTNGMHDYVAGAGEALAEIAQRFTVPAVTAQAHTVNLLGVTPLDFAGEGSVGSLRRILTENGWDVLSCWAMGDELETLAQAGTAAVNLVVSSVGLAAAKVLQKKFGTPYVVGTPISGFTPELLTALEQASENGESTVPYLSRTTSESPKITIIGEPVTMGSLAAAITRQYGCAVRVLCPLEHYEGLLASHDLAVHGEEEAETTLNQAEIVIADPLYRPICDPKVKFYELPHEAFSGRCFRKTMPNLMELKL